MRPVRPAGPRAARIVVLLGALAVATSCRDDDAGSDAEVQDLVLPTAEEREADDAMRAAATFLAAGKPRQAEPLLRRVCELLPKDPKALLLLGQALRDRGANAEATEFLRRAAEADPQSAAAHARLVEALRAQQDLAGAEQACRAWTAALREDDEGWFQLGTVLADLRRLPEAEKALRTAAAKRTSRADVRSQLGLVLLAMGNLEEAETKQRDAIERRQEFAAGWYRLGDVIALRGPARVAEAAEAYERAIGLEPLRVQTHLSLFLLCRTPAAQASEDLRARGAKAWERVLRLQGARQLAEESAGGVAEADPAKTSEFALREELALRPEDPVPRVALARRLHREGRLDEAVDAYRRAIECGAEGWQVRARLGAALLASGDAAGAGTTLAEAATKAPAEAAVQRLLAWALLVRGRDDDAIAACDAALALLPGDPLAKKARALARIHRGETDEGLRDLAAAGGLE